METHSVKQNSLLLKSLQVIQISNKLGPKRKTLNARKNKDAGNTQT
jgi:hypothetical protein